MKIKIDDKVILEITDTMKKVICNEIPIEEIDAEIERRLIWVITHKYEQCFKRLRGEWDTKLAEKERNIHAVPTNKEKYAELVFSQSDYKNRSEREGMI